MADPINKSRNELLLELEHISGASRQDRLIVGSNGFMGTFVNPTINVGDTNYFVIQTGAKALMFEYMDIASDFSSAGNGRFLVEVNAYVDSSDINEWSYGGITTLVDIGRNLNAADVNVSPLAQLGVGLTDVTLTGEPDYNLQFTEYFLDTQGSRESVTSNRDVFFESGGKVLIPPNSEVLVVSAASGSASGPMTNRSMFFTTEIEAE